MEEVLAPNEDSLEIGRVKLSYKLKGTVESASFTPSIKVELDSKLIKEISTIQSSTDVERIRNSSEMVFAAWFTRLNNIELADRNLYRIISKVDKCEKYPDGSVRECEIIFSFERIAK